MRFDYGAIKDLAKEAGCKVDDLLALAPVNDPFYTGRPFEVEAARWFADLWQRFGYSSGVHLRRIHYQVVSQDPPIMRPDGKPYENTQNCWGYLNNASKYARYLRLVDPDAFIDRRNPEALINAQWDHSADPDPGSCVGYDEWDNQDLDLPELPRLAGLPDRLPDLPGLYATGYEDIQQDYLVEIWAEKTTMNDVLEPICKEYGLNLVTGAGELSITAVRQFLKRARDSRRPARILYISDFDPAGLGMPISVARKIEFYQRDDGFGGLDIALQPVVLTADQVKKYRLPRVPVKDSDMRKANFEAAHGEGQVELDALEALHPGELAEIVTGEVLRYYDPGLVRRALQEKYRLQAHLDQVEAGVISQYQNDIASLTGQYRELGDDLEALRAEFAELVKPFQSKIEAYQERLESIKTRGGELYGAIIADLEAADVDLNRYPLPSPALDGDPHGLLYSSQREYLEQISFYKAQREGEELAV